MATELPHVGFTSLTKGEPEPEQGYEAENLGITWVVRGGAGDWERSGPWLVCLAFGTGMSAGLLIALALAAGG